VIVAFIRLVWKLFSFHNLGESYSNDQRHGWGSHALPFTQIFGHALLIHSTNIFEGLQTLVNRLTKLLSRLKELFNGLPLFANQLTKLFSGLQTFVNRLTKLINGPQTLKNGRIR